MGYVLDPFEKAIRGAFEKSDPSDISVRRRVYHSALNALERALQSNASVTEDQAKARRAKLKLLIRSIESEFSVAAPATNPVAKALGAERPAMHSDRLNTPAAGPRERVPTASSRQNEADLGVIRPETSRRPETQPNDIKKPSLAARMRTRNLRNEGKKSRWPKFAFNVAIILGLIFAAVYTVRWVMSTDLRQFASSTSNDGNLEFTSQAVGARQGNNWITIFDPEDLSTVRVGDSAEARLSSDGRATYLQIQSPTVDSEINFDVGLGILQEFMGKNAIIIIRAKTVDDEKSDMAVSCDFNTLGKCSRKRFTVTSELQDFVFDYSFPNKSVRQPGSIKIISDLEGQAKPLNLVAIQIREKPEN